MRIELTLDGKIYKSVELGAENDIATPGKLVAVINDLVWLRIELNGGGLLILGEKAIQRAHIIYYGDEEN